MSATALPPVAVMLLMAAIEILVVADDCQTITLITILFDCFASHNLLNHISVGKSALRLAEDNGHSAIVNALRAAGAH
jgi:hypothetical protein